MNKTSTILLSGLALLLAGASPAEDQQSVPAESAAESWDGLVEVNAQRLGGAFLLPGADFRPYTKVMIEEPEVAFRPNWMRDVNRGSRLAGRVSEADVARIQETVSASTIDIFARAFTDAGFEVVTRGGPDVLRLRTAVVNLFINAPDTNSPGRSRTFTANTGEATLILEARDSETNALLARVVDRRQARSLPGPTTRVSNTADFRALASSWGRIAASSLNSLKEMSPVPDPLTPGHRLP